MGSVPAHYSLCNSRYFHSFIYQHLSVISLLHLLMSLVSRNKQMFQYSCPPAIIMMHLVHSLRIPVPVFSLLSLS